MMDLTVETFPKSPGSSVFDFPTQSSGKSTRPIIHVTVNSPTTSPTATCIIISGGTGGNAICSAFGSDAAYVLPVSDDGGSSSEIIRVLGGPSIGDIRSRLVRLIPSAPPGSPLDAIRTLLAYRLPAHYTEREARDEWRDIVEGRSPLWQGVPNDRKETVRGFLVYFESEILKRAHKNFTFLNGSIGNYFLAAAQGFFRSLPSAIFLFSSITNSQATILPVVVTNHTVTIAAELQNGEKLVGQCEISHPVHPLDDTQLESPVDGLDGVSHAPRNVMFTKEGSKFEPLKANITRLLYINAYGNEIHPAPNPDYISALSERELLVYSCGSLWTSIMPCLALRGVASAIASSSCLKAKILLLNSENDRETDGYSALDYIISIVKILNTAHIPSSSLLGLGNAATTYPVSAFITDLVYLRDTKVKVDVSRIHQLGVGCTEVSGEGGKFTAESVKDVVEDILLKRRQEI